MQNRKAELIETLLPKDTNGYGNIFGGVIMSIMDKTAGVACWRYSKNRVVTACAQRITFHTPINMGEVVYSRASIVYVGRCSMEVEVEVFDEDPDTGIRRRCCDGFLTFVSLGKDNRPAPVPQVLATSEEEQQREREANARRGRRLASRPPRPSR